VIREEASISDFV